MSLKVLQILHDHASAIEIARHFQSCEQDFLSTLSRKVDVNDYSQKLATKAVCYEIWFERVLVGLLAVYCNYGNEAFISNLSILPAWQAQGLASKMMHNCLHDISAKGFKKLSLEVSKSNYKAIHFYHKFGFVIVHSDECAYRMQLRLD